MRKKWGWHEAEVIDGVREVQFDSWTSYLDYCFLCIDGREPDAYIWRGQRCERWDLTPSLIRQLRARKHYIRESEVIRQYKDILLRMLKESDAGTSTTEPWPLGQHYSAYTPLLDWSYRRGVAEFFAFRDAKRPSTRFRVIWSLRWKEVAERAREVARKGFPKAKPMDGLCVTPQRKMPALGGALPQLLPPPPMREFEPEVIFETPSAEGNPRLGAQQGLFSWYCGDLAQWVKRSFLGHSDYPVLIKLLLPNRDRAQVLSDLEARMIHEASLFPDRHGAINYCNRKLDELLGIEGN